MRTRNSLGPLAVAALVVLSACADSATAPPMIGTPTVAASRAVRITTIELGPTNALLLPTPLAINNSRVVVGRLVLVGEQTFHAFRLDDGELTDLGLLPDFAGCCESEATAVNASGDVVGWSGESSEPGFRHAFLWRDGVMTDLGALPDVGGSSNGINNSWANGINPRGDVVGASRFDGPAGTPRHAVLWRHGAITDLGTLPGGWESEATAINPAGDVVGYSSGFQSPRVAVLWRKGVPVDLGTLGATSRATAINPRGDVVGWSGDQFGPRHAVLWKDGAIVDLGARTGTVSEATGISPSGDVVGWWSDTPTSARHAFLWRNGVMIDLAPASTYSYATGVDAAGDVVGWVAPAGSVIWKVD